MPSILTKRGWMVTMLLTMLLIGAFLGAACSSTAELTPTATPAPTIKPTATTAEATPVTEETEAQPTDAGDDEDDTEPAAESQTLQVNALQLSENEAIQLTVLNQYGGVPRGLDVEGDIAYLGMGPHLVIVDVGDPSAPQLLGKSDLLPYNINDLDVVDGMVYLALGRAGLMVIDANQPGSLQIIGSGPGYTTDAPPAATAITVVDNLAYLLDFDRMNGATHLIRLDVTDPGQPVLLGSHELLSNDTFVVNSKHLIVVGNGRLQIRDLSDPDHVLGEAALTSGSYTSRATINGDTVVVFESGGPNGVELFDISDPTNPEALGGLVEIEMFFIDQIAMNDRLVAIGGTFGEFGHCSSQIHLVELGGENAQPAGLLEPESCLTSMAFQGNRLLTTERAGLRIYDLTDPANPALVGEFKNPDGFQDAQGVAFHNEVTYILSAEGDSFDLVTLELGEAGSKVLNERLTVSTSTLLDLFVSGETLIAPIWMGGLNTLDISDPTAPQILHQPTEGELTSGDLFTMVLGENTLYTPVVDGVLIGGIGAIDLSDPAQPLLASTVETGNPMILSLALSGDILYALSQGDTNQVHLYDVSQPLQMVPLGTITLPAPASRLAMVENLVYAGCDSWNCQSLYVIDAADPANPTLIREWALPFGVQEMISDGHGLIYIVTLNDGVWVLDATSPENLRLIGHLLLPSDYARIKLFGDRLYAAALDAGLYIIQITQ